MNNNKHILEMKLNEIDEMQERLLQGLMNT